MIERITVGAVAGAVCGLVVSVGASALGAPAPVTIALGVGLGLALATMLAPRLPVALDGFLPRRPGTSAAWLLLALAAVGQTVLLAGDATHPAPRAPAAGPEHCCLTAPARAAGLWRQGAPNLYRDDLYADSTYAGFRQDPYYYPPPLVLVPIGMKALVGDDFRAQRALWFAFSGLALALALLLLAAALNPSDHMRAVAVLPALWASQPIVLALRMGNAQVLLVAAVLLGFVALPRRRALAGALLAGAIAIKLFPALLLAYWAARRNGRAVAWTLAWGVILVAAAALVLGVAPFRAFLGYQLPRLASGEACRREFASAVAVARDLSPFALPLKLGLLGVRGTGLAQGRVIAQVYAAAALGLTLWAARHAPASPSAGASTWLAVLALASLAGPFAPADYAPIPVVMLVCLDRRLVGTAWACGLALLTFAPFLVPRDAPVPVHLAAHLPMQLAALGVPALVLVRAGRTATAPRVSAALA